MQNSIKYTILKLYKIRNETDLPLNRHFIWRKLIKNRLIIGRFNKVEKWNMDGNCIFKKYFDKFCLKDYTAGLPKVVAFLKK